MFRHSTRRRTTLAFLGFGLILGTAFAAAPLAADDAETPSPAEIVARFVDALGGEEALRAHTSATTKGTFELAAMGMSGELTVYQMAPDKLVTLTSFPGMGESVQGYNGEIAWAEDPMQGARLVEGQMLDDVRRDARFYGELEYDETYPEQTAVGEVEWNGQTVVQLDLVDTAGNKSSQYFAKDSGLLVGMSATMTNEMGTADATFLFSDYEEFDGVVIPTVTSVNLMGMDFVQTIESVTWNDVDESAFEPSETVKALLPE